MEQTAMGFLREFGIIPVMLLMVMMVWFLLREIRLEVKSLLHKINELKVRVEDTEQSLKQFVTKEEHYQFISGWRAEFHEIRRAVERALARGAR